MATVTLYPASFDSSHSYYSASGTTNPVGQSSLSTTYATIQLTRGSSATTYASWSFDTSSIPSGATITSVSCTAKCYINSTNSSYVKTRQIQLYSGSTAKGSASTVSTSTSALTMTAGTWTRDELSSAKIRVYGVRGTSNTSTNYYFRFYGATLTVNYVDVTHTLTIDDGGFNVSPESGEYSEGSSVSIIISEDSMPNVTLDGADITDLFTSQTLATSYSGAPSASSYTGVSSGTSGIASAVGMTAESPYGDSLNWYGSSGATVDSQYAEYTFDLSSIPSTATDIAVACKVAGTAETTTYTHSAGGRYSVWGLCCNGTAKGSQIYTTSGSVTVIEFSDTGSWTREELDGLQLRHYVGYYGGSTNGATLTISYSLPGNTEVFVYNLTIDADHTIVVSSASSTALLHVKLNGTWVLVSKVYQKVNGSWTEVTDLASLFSNATNNTNSGYFINK